MIGFGQIAVGLGGDKAMARWFPKASHLQCLQADPRFEIVGVADRSPEAQARAKAVLPEAVVVDDDAVALAPLQPEVAVLAIPPPGRLDAIRGLSSLRGIMLEKPLGGVGARVQFAAECERRNVVVQGHYCRRGDPTLRKLQAGELARRIGSLQTAFALYGNGLRNNGSHLINLITMLLGEIKAVRATTSFMEGAHLPLRGDGHAAFVLDLACGAQVSVQPVDFRHYREIALDIWGTSGRICIAQEGLSIASYPLASNRGLDAEAEIAGDQPEMLPITVGEATPSLYGNLADALAGAADLMSPLSSAQATELALDAIIASAESGGSRVTLQA
jgi:predicted dehydrogenase